MIHIIYNNYTVYKYILNKYIIYCTKKNMYSPSLEDRIKADSHAIENTHFSTSHFCPSGVTLIQH